MPHTALQFTDDPMKLKGFVWRVPPEVESCRLCIYDLNQDIKLQRTRSAIRKS